MSSSTLKEIDGRHHISVADAVTIEEESTLKALKKKKNKALEKGNLKEVADLSNILGETLHRAGQLWDAIEQHEEERQYCDVLADRLGVAFAHRKIGECHFDLGEYSKALRHQKLHLQIAEEESSHVEQQRALATIGRTYFQHASEVEDVPRADQRHLLRKAESAYLRSLEKCELLRGHIEDAEYQEMKTRLLLNIGLVFQEYNDGSSQEDARKYVLKSLTLAKRFNLKEDIYRAASGLADMCVTWDVQQAADYAQKALDTALKTRSKEMQRDAMAIKAKVCLHQQRYTQAKHLWKKIYKMTSARSNPDDFAVAKTSVIKAARLEHLWSQLASTHDDRSRYPLLEKCASILVDLQAPAAAVTLYQQVLKISESTNCPGTSVASIYSALADALSSLHQHTEASQYYQQGAAIWGSQRIGQAWKAYQNAVECEESLGSEIASITALYNQALDLAQEAGSVKHQKAILRDLADFYKQQNNTDGEESAREQLATLSGTPGDSEELSQGSVESEEEESQGQSEDSDSDISISVISDTDTSDHDEDFDRGSAKDRLNRQRWEKKRNGKGETPLHLACIKGELDRVKFLIKTGHPMTMRDYAGWLPLHEACSHGHEEIVAYLLDHGADKDARGDQDTTPLIDSCSAGHLHVAHLLVDRGADLELKDKRGNMALAALRSLRADSRAHLTRTELHQIRALERRLVGDGGDLPVPEEDMEDSEVQHSQRPRVAGNHIEEEEETQEDSEEQMLANPYHEEEREENPHQAGHMYRELLHNIRSRNTTTQDEPAALSSRSSRKSRSTASPPPALIRAGEDVGDNWIEDDLGHQPRAKRRRKNVNGYLYGNTAWKESRSRRNSSSSPKRRSSTKSKHSVVEVQNTGDGDEDDSPMEDIENGENLSPAFSSQTSSRVSILSQTSTMDNQLKDVNRLFESSDDDAMDIIPSNRTQMQRTHKQMKLTDFTHQDHHTERTRGLSDIPDNVHLPQGALTTAPVAYPSFPNPAVGGVRRIQVKIQDKTIMVPVQPNTNVGVLATEAASRYCKLCAVRPRLSLRTGGGAVLLEDDMVADLLQNDEEVDGIVNSWDLQPLTVRYTQACADLGVGVYEDIESRLTEGIVSLSGLSLTSSNFQPLSRALQCHTTLTELRLAGVGLSDGDMAEIPVSSLTALHLLDVSANRLSHKAVHHLGENWLAKPLQSLHSLSLSHSSLGEMSGNQLCGLLEGCPALRRLHLVGCKLQPHTLHGQHRARLKAAMAGLTKVDVSYNKSLGVLGCELLLHCLNAASIRTLNLSSTVLSYTNDLLPNHLVSYVSQSDCVLEKLQLNNCSLTTHQTARLARLISLCPTLQHFSLNTNPRLLYTDIITLLASAINDSNTKLRTLHSVLGLTSTKTPSLGVSSEWQFPESLREFWIGPGLRSKDFEALGAAWRAKWGQERSEGCLTKSGVIKMSVTDNGE